MSDLFFAEAHLVPLRDTESKDHVSSSTMASLVVVVVNEDQCVMPVHHAPTFAEVVEVFQLVVAAEGFAQVLAVPELRHTTVANILLAGYGFATYEL